MENIEKKETVCEFCGQVLLLEQECSCVDAKIHRKKQNAYDEAVEEIQNLVPDWPDEYIHCIESAVNEIIFNFMKSAVFEDIYGVKLKLSTASKGYIKVEKTKTCKSSVTI